MHICTVCLRLAEDHEEKHWPPPCCPGCDCGSFELAHSGLTPLAPDRACAPAGDDSGNTLAAGEAWPLDGKGEQWTI